MDKQRFKSMCLHIGSGMDFTHEEDTTAANDAERFDPELARKMRTFITARREMCEYVRSRTGKDS